MAWWRSRITKAAVFGWLKHRSNAAHAANYADHPNVGGVIMIELGCEKTNLSIVEQYLHRKGGN
jgi:altronate dehydratase